MDVSVQTEGADDLQNLEAMLNGEQRKLESWPGTIEALSEPEVAPISRLTEIVEHMALQDQGCATRFIDVNKESDHKKGSRMQRSLDVDVLSSRCVTTDTQSRTQFRKLKEEHQIRLRSNARASSIMAKLEFLKADHYKSDESNSLRMTSRYRSDTNLCA